ncbi:MAG: hypothetical protein H0X04_07800 [Chthoniobacterales bacterium]|nr:hypothetical protein [Chthoniobacterales bacterium]
MSNLDETKLDGSHFSVLALGECDEKEYWLSKSPEERWEAIELLRQMMYGYDPARARLQRVLTVAALGED